jgi:hypothetical protein
VNTATSDRIIKTSLTEINILNPLADDDIETIAEAIQNADEMATAIPSVEYYDTDGSSCIAALLANHIK